MLVGDDKAADLAMEEEKKETEHNLANEDSDMDESPVDHCPIINISKEEHEEYCKP